MILAPGSKLGPYEILSPIGAGGMGEVWKARDTRLGRIVAVKKVKEQHSERFKQEARIIAALNHPNICQIHDIGDDYLVLEYVEGKPLSSPLPEQEAVRLAIQIATALEEAHQKGIIHRDLKPSNIMVTDKGSVKLLDFGLAKLYEQDASMSSLPTADIPATVAGTVLGTAAYMCPEQAQGKPTDTRSDIFSFGLILYEMLSGRRAFSGDSASEAIAALLRDEPPPLQTSSQIEKIVKECLEKQPSARYQTMSEVREVLEKILEQKASQSSTETQLSIAVLPFVNMSGDKEQEYFSDGLAEEIINALTKIPGLKVIARTSAFAFKGKQEDIRRIAEILGVANILEGSVRKAGNRIRVTAQLITAADGSHLWSDRYDRDLTDIFAIQDEIAGEISNVLQVKLATVPSIQRRYKPNQAAYEAYLKARYLRVKFSTESREQSRKYLDQAIALDPEFALAHCALADYFLMLTGVGFTSAHEGTALILKEARKALAIDPSLPEAHTFLGVVAGCYDYDWREAERCFRLGMSHEPVPPLVQQRYGTYYLLPTGRAAEAVECIVQNLRADPLNIGARLELAFCLYAVGKLSEAKVEGYRILELEESHALGCLSLACYFAFEKKWTEALYYAEKGSPRLDSLVGTHAGILKQMGEIRQADEMIQKLMPGNTNDALLGLFFFYLICGEMDKAADWMSELIQQRYLNAALFASGYFRSSSQWPLLAKMLNLPE